MIHIKHVIDKIMKEKGFIYDKEKEEWIHPDEMKEVSNLVIDDTDNKGYEIEDSMDMFTKTTHFCLNHTNKQAYNKIVNAENELEKRYLQGRKSAFKDVINFMMGQIANVPSLEMIDENGGA